LFLSTIQLFTSLIFVVSFENKISSLDNLISLIIIIVQTKLTIAQRNHIIIHLPKSIDSENAKSHFVKANTINIIIIVNMAQVKNILCSLILIGEFNFIFSLVFVLISKNKFNIEFKNII
jgi:hypothetical protein